jgi:ankyrin repeat protein
VDILDKKRVTALQAFFGNLDNTHNPTHAAEIAIRMLSLSPKDGLDRQLPNGNRLFNLAIRFQNDKLVQELYNGGINTEERDSTSEHRSSLELFCLYGVRDVGILKNLIKTCRNLSELDFDGLSLLHLAANSGLVKVARELLDGGIDVNIKSREGVTALCHAVNAGHTSIVELLLDNDATTKDCPAEKHYMASLLSCAPNIAICRLLADRGLNDWTERTECSFRSPFVPGFTDPRSRQSTTSAWSSNVRQLTPLHHHAFRGSLEVIKYVVEHVKDVDLDIEAERGIRPLFLAILNERTSIVRYLLEQGARPDGVYQPTQWTMLHLAAHLGNVEIVTILLGFGAGM